MNVILLHNPKAGSSDPLDAGKLLEALRAAGHSVTYQATDLMGSDTWARSGSTDLVVSAGGDGTVRKAALTIHGQGIPLAILPLGTANNIAKSFGITSPLPELIRGLDAARRVPLNIGLAKGPWGEIPFVESAGAGLIARLIFNARRKLDGPAPSVSSGARFLRQLLEDFPAHEWHANVDGREFEGNFLLAEAVNIHSIGPNLKLARGGRPPDGFLDFAFLKEENRAAFGRFLDSPGKPSTDRFPLENVRGRNLRLSVGRRDPLHADDFTWPEEDRQDEPDSLPGRETEVFLEVSLAENPIEILVPQ